MYDATAAKVEADAFVRDHLQPALNDAVDGGFALMNAVVDQLFFDAAYHDEAGDMDNAEKCLEVARQAIERGRAA